MIRQSEDSQGRAGFARPFFYVVMEAFRLKMRCAGCVSFIYNGEGHGKVGTEIQY